MTETMTETERATDRRAGFIRGLREFADFMDAHPDVPVPYNPQFQYIALEREDLATLARQLGRADKIFDGNYLTVRREFGPLAVEAWSHRDNVCERVVTGKRTVERPVTQTVGTETVEEEIVEWRCEPLLAGSTEGSGVEDVRAGTA